LHQSPSAIKTGNIGSTGTFLPRLPDSIPVREIQSPVITIYSPNIVDVLSTPVYGKNILAEQQKAKNKN
jgi:hypothetical protein